MRECYAPRGGASSSQNHIFQKKKTGSLAGELYQENEGGRWDVQLRSTQLNPSGLLSVKHRKRKKSHGEPVPLNAPGKKKRKPNPRGPKGKKPHAGRERVGVRYSDSGRAMKGKTQPINDAEKRRNYTRPNTLIEHTEKNQKPGDSY